MGDDIRPSPPLEYANTRSLYTFPGVRLEMYASNLLSISIIVSFAVLMS